MRKQSYFLAALALAVGTLAGCAGASNETTAAATEAATEAAKTEAAGEQTETEAPAAPAEMKKIIVGASPAPHAEILEAAKEVLAAKGYELDIKEYVDYIQPNMALDGGDLDANYFQHLPYLEGFNVENGTDLVSAAMIHYEPFGIYAGKSASLEELPDKAVVAVPNDTTNEARALLLLEANGLIKLKEDAGINATKNDIVENPKNLNIYELEAAQIPRSMKDVDIAVINGNYAIEAGLKVSDALAIEDADSIGATTYGNVVAVQAGRENDEAIVALVEALMSDEVKAFMEATYEGAVVPVY